MVVYRQGSRCSGTRISRLLDIGARPGGSRLFLGDHCSSGARCSATLVPARLFCFLLAMRFYARKIGRFTACGCFSPRRRQLYRKLDKSSPRRRVGSTDQSIGSTDRPTSIRLVGKVHGVPVTAPAGPGGAPRPDSQGGRSASRTYRGYSTGRDRRPPFVLGWETFGEGPTSTAGRPILRPRWLDQCGFLPGERAASSVEGPALAKATMAYRYTERASGSFEAGTLESSTRHGGKHARPWDGAE